MITSNVSKRRVIPLSVETNEPWSALAADRKNARNESPTAVMSGGFARYGGRAPPPPKSPLHGARRAAASEAQAPSRGGADKMLLLRQMNVTSSAGYQTVHTGGALHDSARPGQLPPLGQPQAPAPVAVVAAPVPELSAAQIHKERKLAESKRRQEVQLMTQEDYTGKAEGQERLSRQEERTQMAEEELHMARIVQAEKAHLRAQQLQQQREEEARIRDMYLTKLRLEREEKERVAKEKEIARKQALEEKMKALKEAADAKAREEYAVRQRRIEEEALIEREQRISEMEIARLAVEDELAGAMRQEYLAEVERKQQIAVEEAQWKQFEAAEAQKQLEATLKRRAAQAEQYEQDKQRRMEIHRLQKERARLAERKHKQTHEEAVSEAHHVEHGGSQRSLLDNIIASSAHEGEKSKEDILTIGDESPRSEATPVDSIDLSHNEEDSSTENAASSIGDGCESNPREKDDASATPSLDKAKGSNDGEVARPDLSATEPCEEVDERMKASECQQESQAAETVQNDIPEPGELKHEQIAISTPQDEADKVPLFREQSLVKEEEPNAGAKLCEPVREDQDEEVSEHQQNLSDGPAMKAAEAQDSNGKKEDEPLLNDDEGSSSDGGNPLQPTENEAGCPVPDHVEGSTTSDSHEGEASSTLLDQQQPQLLSVRDARAYGLDPFAQVLHVKDNSPAMEATLKAGDLLIDFGGIKNKTPNCLLLMAEKVKSFVNRDIELLVLRPEDSTLSIGENEEGGKFTRESLSLRPRKWEGKGLLGCQLNPFKWVEEQDPEPERTGDLANHDAAANDEHAQDGGSANLLVFYNVAPDSIADQIGIKNGDLLMKCGELGFANDLGAVAEYFQAIKAEQISIELEIQRWIPEDQQYQQLVLVLPASTCGPLGCSMTTFTEYYSISEVSAVDTDAAATLSACMDCYYTTLATAVHAAALNGHITCLEALYEASRQEENANTEDQKSSSNSVLDWRDGDGRSPLFYACYAQQVESVKFLLAHMAHDEVFDPLTGGDLYGDSPLHAATLSGFTEILILLLESKYIVVDVVNATQLACAHVAPNCDVLELLGERFSADLLAADSDGRMPLSHACLRNDLESVAYLCEKHPDFVDYADANGNTPLHLSAWLGYLDVIKVLVKYLPAIAMYMPNQDGSNPLEIAQASDYDETAQFLEKCMAASNQNDEEYVATT